MATLKMMATPKMTSIAPNIRERVRPGSYAVTFTVEGSGEFPFDMLRYDACYPATEREDVLAIVANYYDDNNLPKRRRVVLIARPVMGEKFVSLTPARWQSFGWHFIGIGALRDTIQYTTPGKEDFFHRAVDGDY